MLTTILYRSHIADDVPVKILPAMVAKACQLNEQHGVTGILLFNGTHFFQVLEGPLAGVLAIYQRICADARHHNLVELMRDYAPARRFGNAGMALFDLRQHEKSEVLQAVLEQGTSRYQLTYDDRALQFLRTFVESREKENYYEVLPATLWDFVKSQPGANADQHQDVCTDAPVVFQPVVDPFARQITAVDGELVCGLDATEKVPGAGQQEADLQRLRQILAAWHPRQQGNMMLNVSLAPQTLGADAQMADAIEQAILNAGLVPEQVAIGIDEKAIIPDLNRFMVTVNRLKSAGISLCINNFGAGSAGLSLLTLIQPERLKIDASIIRDLHRSGPKQAVVQAIIRCCSALEIVVVAGDITQAEEWMWLEAAGVINFQGPLFAGYGADHPSAIAWPEYREAGNY